MSHAIKYRDDIDGIRALAVLIVIFFHADIPFFSGGYVGVDIFFVISGYLITSIIYSEIRQGQFSFKVFWLRRARRILPASLLVMSITLFVFSLIYPVAYFQELGASAAAQSLFISNIFFWKQSGYFGSGVELKPLLHMWSLAVEEQFYLFFPVLIWVLHRFFKSWLATFITLLILISLSLSIWAVSDYSVASFFLLPTRAWELGIGALLGIFSVRKTGICKNIIVGNIVSLLSLIIIFCVVYFFDNKTPFPSYTALAPVMATAALIWANASGKTLANHTLSFKPIVWIGLISYSLYLWHWPINVLGSWIFYGEESIAYYIFILIAPFFLAYLSYRFIETPIRRNRELFSNRRIILLSLLGSIFILAAGSVSNIFGNGYIVDRDGKIRAFYAKAVKPELNREKCGNLRHAHGEETKICQYIGNPKTKSMDYFIWGDSQAGAIMPAFLQFAETAAVNIEYSTAPGCQPVIDMKKISQSYCPKFNNNVLKKISSSKYKAVILSGSFVENINQGNIRDVNAPDIYSSAESIKEFRMQFKKTVDAIHAAGSKVVIFTELPRPDLDPVKDHVRRSILGMPVRKSYINAEQHINRIKPIYNIIDNAGIDLRLNYPDEFCSNQGPCKYLYQGDSLYKDSGHISNLGTQLLAPKIEAALLKLMISQPN